MTTKQKNLLLKTTSYVAAAAIAIGASGCGQSEGDIQKRIRSTPRIVELQKADYKLFTEPFEYNGASLAIVPDISLPAAMGICNEKKMASKVEIIDAGAGVVPFYAIRCEPVDLGK